MDMDDSGDMGPAGVDFDIRNVSDSTIANVLFEAAFYDIEGNIVDTVKHR